MAVIRFEKVIGALPGSLTANTVYLVRTGVGFDFYMTDATGAVAHKANSGDGWTTQVLAANFTAINGTPVNTPLAFAPEPNAIYEFEGRFMLSTNAVTGGIRTGLRWPATGIVRGVASASTVISSNGTSNVHINAPNNLDLVPAGHAVADVPFRSIMDANFITDGTVSGNIQTTLSSENGQTLATMFAGSYIRWRKVAAAP